MSEYSPTQADADRTTYIFIRTAIARRERRNEEAADVMAAYFSDDPELGREQLFGIVAAGSVITAAALRKQAGAKPVGDNAGGMWAMLPVAVGEGASPASIDQLAPNARTAIRLVMAAMNNDHDGLSDLLAAYFREHGDRGLMGVLIQLVTLFAATESAAP